MGRAGGVPLAEGQFHDACLTFVHICLVGCSWGGLGFPPNSPGFPVHPWHTQWRRAGLAMRAPGRRETAQALALSV